MSHTKQHSTAYRRDTCPLCGRPSRGGKKCCFCEQHALSRRDDEALISTVIDNRITLEGLFK